MTVVVTARVYGVNGTGKGMLVAKRTVVCVLLWVPPQCRDIEVMQ